MPNITSDGFLVPGRDALTQRLQLTVDSTTGLDVNRVVFKIYKSDLQPPACSSLDERASNYRCVVFDYAGKDDGSSPSLNVDSALGDTESKVLPKPLPGPGLEEFDFAWDWDLMDRGTYVIRGEARSIRGDSKSAEQNVTILPLVPQSITGGVVQTTTETAPVPWSGQITADVTFGLSAIYIPDPSGLSGPTAKNPVAVYTLSPSTTNSYSCQVSGQQFVSSSGYLCSLSIVPVTDQGTVTGGVLVLDLQTRRFDLVGINVPDLNVVFGEFIWKLTCNNSDFGQWDGGLLFWPPYPGIGWDSTQWPGQWTSDGSLSFNYSYNYLVTGVTTIATTASFSESNSTVLP